MIYHVISIVDIPCATTGTISSFSSPLSTLTATHIGCRRKPLCIFSDSSVTHNCKMQLISIMVWTIRSIMCKRSHVGSPYEKILDNVSYCFVTGQFWLHRSSHKPLFIRMSALQSDWSYSGLKGIIPSLLHHSLLGYHFFIPDAVGNTCPHTHEYTFTHINLLWWCIP